MLCAMLVETGNGEYGAMTKRTWPKTARVLLAIGVVLASLGVISAIVVWALQGEITVANSVASLSAVIVGVAFALYSLSAYARDPKRVAEYDKRGDMF